MTEEITSESVTQFSDVANNSKHVEDAKKVG